MNSTRISGMSGCFAFLAAVMAACGGGNGGQAVADAAAQVGADADLTLAATRVRLDIHAQPSHANKDRGRQPNPQPVSGSASGVDPITALAPTPAPAPAPVPAPAPAPAPSLMPGGTTFPTIDVLKIPTGSIGVAVDQMRPTTEVPGASDGSGNFRTVCEFSHMAFDDPIVFPGQPGKSHLHAFFGNTATNAGTTPQSLSGSGNSTCRGGTINRSAYWVPAIVDTKDGTPIKPLMLIAYYKTGYTLAPSSIKAVPVGLRMIAGDPARSTAQQSGPATFKCINPIGTGVASNSLPNCLAVTETLWMSITFPQCWDGLNLDSPDHKSHMAYPSAGRCPTSHPVALPEISFNVLYAPTETNSMLRWRLSSDNYDPSLPGGYSAHADWFNGWKPEIMDAWIRGCNQAAKDCHAHLLGDGRMIY